MYSSTLFLTSALDTVGGYPREREPVFIAHEADSNPGPVWMGAQNIPQRNSIPGSSSESL